MSKWRWSAAALGLGVVAGMATAAADDKSEYCEQVHELTQELDDIEKLAPTTSMEKAREEFREIQKEAVDVRHASRELAARAEARTEKAEKELMSALKRIPDKATVAEGRRMIQPELQALRQARQQAASDLECPEE